jgi:hypothetical protein
MTPFFSAWTTRSYAGVRDVIRAITALQSMTTINSSITLTWAPTPGAAASSPRWDETGARQTRRGTNRFC